jgi:hypothetical protein
MYHIVSDCRPRCSGLPHNIGCCGKLIVLETVPRSNVDHVAMIRSAIFTGCDFSEDYVPFGAFPLMTSDGPVDHPWYQHLLFESELLGSTISTHNRLKIIRTGDSWNLLNAEALEGDVDAMIDYGTVWRERVRQSNGEFFEM